MTGEEHSARDRYREAIEATNQRINEHHKTYTNTVTKLRAKVKRLKVKIVELRAEIEQLKGKYERP